MLWRPSAAAETRLELRAQRVATAMRWPAGQQTLRLPTEFVVDGGSLVVQLDAEPQELVVHVLPETIEETQWGEILIWMAARDCRGQAQFLVDGLNDGSLFPEQGRTPGLSEL